MSKSDLQGRLALVTGTTGGIGLATCHDLASTGCSIAVHYHSAASTAESLVNELRAKKVKAESFQADLRNYEGVRKLHKKIVQTMGAPLILFNNAGITIKHGVNDISGVSVEMFEETWRANCGSAFLLTQLCLPEMERLGWGRIIFCSSVAGFIGGVVGPHYASSKSALHGLIHWLSQWYGPKGITANGVAPALIKNTKMLPGDPGELANKVPIGRLGSPEEIAETVIWM
ncbi:hypothetical protein ACLMJK_004275 [Lecanora helva]